MGFQVAPEPVGRTRSLVAGAAVATAGISIVLVGLVAAGGKPGQATSPAASRTPSSNEAAAPLSSLAPAPIVAGPLIRILPARAAVDCHDAGPTQCGQLVRAAVAQLPVDAPAVQAVGVSTSILCRGWLDCPASRFAGYRPLGSAVVSFGAGQPRAWVNVVEPAPYPGRVWVPSDIRAWVINWAP